LPVGPVCPGALAAVASAPVATAPFSAPVVAPFPHARGKPEVWPRRPVKCSGVSARSALANSASERRSRRPEARNEPANRRAAEHAVKDRLPDAKGRPVGRPFPREAGRLSLRRLSAQVVSK
jgi:hypothetical protein